MAPAYTTKTRYIVVTTPAKSAFAVPLIPYAFIVVATPAANTGANRTPISITIKVVMIPMTSPIDDIDLPVYKGIYL